MLGTDWGEWSLNNEGELDGVIQEDYRRADDDDEGDEDEDAETKEDNQTFGVCFLPQFRTLRGFAKLKKFKKSQKNWIELTSPTHPLSTFFFLETHH